MIRAAGCRKGCRGRWKQGAEAGSLDQGPGWDDGRKWRGPEQHRRQNQLALVMSRCGVVTGAVKSDAQASGLVIQAKEHL